jgi:hypothetical protein
LQTFFQNVLFTNEATFTNDSQVLGCRRPMMASTSSISMPVVNVWWKPHYCPYFIEVNVNGERYTVFLLNILPPLLQDTTEKLNSDAVLT